MLVDVLVLEVTRVSSWWLLFSVISVAIVCLVMLLDWVSSTELDTVTEDTATE